MLDSQISNVQNTADVICNWMIQLLSCTCKYYGITYGQLNMLLLSIGVLLICSYSIGTIFKNKIILKVSLYLTILSIIFIFLMFSIVPLPNMF